MSLILSRELEETALGLKAKANMDGLPPEEAAELAYEMQALSRIAFGMEQELQVHRLKEAGRHGMRMVEELATTTALPLFRDGNVITPDFGRRT